MSIYLFDFQIPTIMSVLRNIGKIHPSSAALFLCDMQAKFRPSITHFDAIVQNSNKVLAAAQHMEGSRVPGTTK